MIRVRCPACESALKVPSKLVGKDLNCPKCGKAFHVGNVGRPVLAAPLPAQRVSENASALAPAKSRAALLAVLCTICVVAVGIGVLWYTMRGSGAPSRNDPSRSSRTVSSETIPGPTADPKFNSTDANATIAWADKKLERLKKLGKPGPRIIDQEKWEENRQAMLAEISAELEQARGKRVRWSFPVVRVDGVFSIVQLQVPRQVAFQHALGLRLQPPIGTLRIEETISLEVAKRLAPGEKVTIAAVIKEFRIEEERLRELIAVKELIPAAVIFTIGDISTEER